jgi:4-amino-4-deoxy-L-arabinose transferase-like glycosyltransferase
VKASEESWGAALRLTRAQTWRVAASLVCVLVTSVIGYAYALNIRVEGWQFWVWLVCVIAVVVLLMPAGRPSLRIGTTARWLVLIALAALLLRATFLEIIPGKLHVDELGVARFALQHTFPEGSLTHNPFITGPASQPALYHYLIRISSAVAGNSISGLRITSVLAGTLAVLATYAAVAELDNRRAALFAAVFMTAYHYHVHWSRIGLNNVWDTLWVPLMLATFAWGWERRWSGGAVLSGVVVGLSQYFYSGSRIGLFLLAYLVIRTWRQKVERPRLAVHGGKLLIVAACIAAPLAMFALRDPANFFLRAQDIFAWRPDAIVVLTHGEVDVWAFFWHQLTRSVGAFTTYPDNTGFYGPGVPLLIGLAAPLFVAGLLMSFFRRQFVPALWILLTVIFGGFLLAAPPSSSHYVVSIPAICWLMAMPLNWLVESGRWRWAVVALLFVMVADLTFYFGQYVPSAPKDLIHPFPDWPPSA